MTNTTKKLATPLPLEQLTNPTWSTHHGWMEVTVHEAKTHLSRLLRRVEAGETVVIKRGSVRVAVLGPAPVITEERSIWGSLDGSMSEDFDAPLDDFATHS